MIVKEEFLSKLRRFFSLNLYEVKIWTALLSRGVSTAGELTAPQSSSAILTDYGHLYVLNKNKTEITICFEWTVSPPTRVNPQLLDN